MKNMIKNDEAVSVVVGSILVLAVLMTFMSVVTSTWVPIYERTAESGHSDELFDTFLDLRKQIENADEFPKISTVNLGTDEMSLMKNSNSVGTLELNESAGTMTLTSTIYYSSTSADVGETLNINNLDTSADAPIQNFSFSFVTDTKYSELPSGKVPDFYVELKSNTEDPLRIVFKDDDDDLEIRIEYGRTYYYRRYSSSYEQRWENDDIGVGTPGFEIKNSTDGYAVIEIDMLNNAIDLELDEPEDGSVAIGNKTYYEDDDDNNEASLFDLIQHYLKLPADGTYDLEYTTYRYDGVTDGTQILLYDTTEGTVGGTRPQLNLMTIGGGVLTMESDYNFMVDQSYIYDSGAVILKQEDGAVFKVGAPIFVTTDSVSDDLIISFQTVVLTGEHVSGGNGLETIQTVLSSPEYVASGLTDNITIIKKTTPELYDLWDSYFSELKDFLTDESNASWDDIPDYNNSQVGININSDDKNILLTVQTKQITLT